MKKYEFTGETLVYEGKTLNRIKRLSDGLVGGWIEKYDNLDHFGNCFIYNNAKVYGNAKVFDNAIICNNATVCDNAMVCNDAMVCDNAMVRGNATVRDRAMVRDNAVVCDNVVVRNNAEVYGNAKVKDSDKILGEIQIPYNQIEFYQGNNTRMITAIKTLDNKWLFNVGCQKLITKEEFLDRIYNEDGGLENNPHREFYLRILHIF